MKRPLLQLLLLPLLTAMLLCGCGQKEDSKKLRMATNANFPPYECIENGRIVGIDPAIVSEICSRNGYELVIENMEFGALLAAVQSGKSDIAASGITIKEERKQQVNFTTPYVVASQMVLVRAGSSVKTTDDLKKCRVGVQEGTTGDDFVKKNFQEPERYKDPTTLVQALLTGKLDAAVLDNEPANIFARRHRGKLLIWEKPLTEEHYAFGISKARPELLQMFNETLELMKVDGTLDRIIAENRIKYQNHTPSDELPETFWQKLKFSFHTNFVAENRYLYLLEGFSITMLVTCGAIFIGIFLGFLVAVIRATADQTGKLKAADLLCRIYLTVIRGTPVVVQLLIIYFVIFGSTDVDKITVAIAAFGLNSGAYVAEIIRSGIMSIDHGQLEAGRSLGLSYRKTMLFIILPQALKNVLPALGNEFIVLLKETSICGYIALADLTKGGDIIRSQTYNAFLPLLAVALIYLTVVVIFTKLLEVLEKRLKKNE